MESYKKSYMWSLKKIAMSCSTDTKLLLLCLTSLLHKVINLN